MKDPDIAIGIEFEEDSFVSPSRRSQVRTRVGRAVNLGRFIRHNQ